MEFPRPAIRLFKRDGRDRRGVSRHANDDCGAGFSDTGERLFQKLRKHAVRVTCRRPLFDAKIAGLLQGRVALGHRHGKGKTARQGLDGGVGRRRPQCPVGHHGRKCDDRNNGGNQEGRDAVAERVHRCTGRVLTCTVIW